MIITLADEGKVAEHDLCTHATLNCALNLSPGVAGNCIIAEALYNLSVANAIVPAVMECTRYTFRFPCLSYSLPSS